MRRAFSHFSLRLAACAALMLAALTCASPAHAGAWPRAKGAGFLSSASRITRSAQGGGYGIYSTTFFEYGLGHGVTAGFDFGRGISGKTKSILFLRAPPLHLRNSHLLAVELGAGEVAGALTLRPGLSYGVGFAHARGIIGALSDGSGWLSIETYAEFRPATRRTDLKADFTLGLNHGARVKSILQIQTGKSGGDPLFMRLAPSVVISIGKFGQIELGATADVAGGDHYGLKLGLWRAF